MRPSNKATIEVDASGVDAAIERLQVLRAEIEALAAMGLPMTIIISRLMDEDPPPDERDDNGPWRSTSDRT